MFTVRHSSILEQDNGVALRQKASPFTELTFQLDGSGGFFASAQSGLVFQQQRHQQQQQPAASWPRDQRPSSAWRHRNINHGNPLQAFAVLSGGRLFGIRHDGSIRHTFNKIDVDQKGHITEADLAAFAEAHSLPAAYVRPFLNAVLAHQQEQQQQQHGWGSGAGDNTLQQPLSGGSEDEVSFDAFHAFVQSREEGLRQAFDAFDVDRDGRISPEDLCCSLARVAICCPGGCVVRPRREVVGQLMSHLNVEPGRRLTFPEFRNFFMLLPEQGQLVEYWLSGPAALRCADMGGHFSLQETGASRKGSPWGHLLAGAIAGAASRSATAPLETLRLAAMAGHVPPGTSLLSAAQQLMAAGGLPGLYRGNLVNVLRSAPARAVDFFAFDLFKAWLGSDTSTKTFAAAGLAGTFSWVLLYPLEVVRSRMTLNSGATYRGIGHCVTSMMAAEGPRAFYRGLGASVAAIAPEAAITYGLHDLLKRGYRSAYHTDPGVVPSLVCGVFAAWSGQLVAFPLETVSRRMQLSGAGAAAVAVAAGGSSGGAAAVARAGAPAAADGMLSVLASLLREGGPGALYRGLGAATLRLVPSAMISFGMYELVQKLWLESESCQEESVARSHFSQLATALSTAQACGAALTQLQQQGLRGPELVQAASAAGCAPCQLQQEQLLSLAGSCLDCSSSSSSSAADNSSCGARGPPVPVLPSPAQAAAIADVSSSSSNAAARPVALAAAEPADSCCCSSSSGGSPAAVALSTSSSNTSGADGGRLLQAPPSSSVCVLTPPPAAAAAALPKDS